MAHEKQPPPSKRLGGGEKVVDDQSVPPKPLRSTRQVFGRIAIGDDLLVATLEGDKVDVRVHTPTGGLHFPSKNGLTIKREHVAALIEVLASMTLEDSIQGEADAHA